jgi:hypothetical protein
MKIKIKGKRKKQTVFDVIFREPDIIIFITNRNEYYYYDDRIEFIE